jgi:hypothetical protein
MEKYTTLLMIYSFWFCLCCIWKRESNYFFINIISVKIINNISWWIQYLSSKNLKYSNKNTKLKINHNLSTIYFSPKDAGPKKKMNCWHQLSIDLERINGRWLQDMFLIEWVSSADRDGIIIWILISIRMIGVNKKNGRCILDIFLSEVDGLNWRNYFLEELIMASRIIGTLSWRGR